MIEIKVNNFMEKKIKNNRLVFQLSYSEEISKRDTQGSYIPIS